MQYMNYLYNCKCLRVKNICLFKIKMLRYLRSSFQGEYCDKVYYQIYFMVDIYPLGMSYCCSGCLGDTIIPIWTSDKFSHRWRSSMANLYSSSEVVVVAIVKVSTVRHFYFDVKNLPESVLRLPHRYHHWFHTHRIREVPHLLRVSHRGIW